MHVICAIDFPGPLDLDGTAHHVTILARRPQLLLDANVALARANLTVLGEEDFLNPALKAGFTELSTRVASSDYIRSLLPHDR